MRYSAVRKTDDCSDLDSTKSYAEIIDNDAQTMEIKQVYLKLYVTFIDKK